MPRRQHAHPDAVRARGSGPRLRLNTGSGRKKEKTLSIVEVKSIGKNHIDPKRLYVKLKINDGGLSRKEKFFVGKDDGLGSSALSVDVESDRVETTIVVAKKRMGRSVILGEFPLKLENLDPSGKPQRVEISLKSGAKLEIKVAWTSAAAVEKSSRLTLAQKVIRLISAYENDVFNPRSLKLSREFLLTLKDRVIGHRTRYLDAAMEPIMEGKAHERMSETIENALARMRKQMLRQDDAMVLLDLLDLFGWVLEAYGQGCPKAENGKIFTENMKTPVIVYLFEDARRVAEKALKNDNLILDQRQMTIFSAFDSTLDMLLPHLDDVSMLAAAGHVEHACTMLVEHSSCLDCIRGVLEDHIAAILSCLAEAIKSCREIFIKMRENVVDEQCVGLLADIEESTVDALRDLAIKKVSSLEDLWMNEFNSEIKDCPLFANHWMQLDNCTSAHQVLMFWLSNVQNLKNSILFHSKSTLSMSSKGKNESKCLAGARTPRRRLSIDWTTNVFNTVRVIMFRSIDCYVSRFIQFFGQDMNCKANKETEGEIMERKSNVAIICGRLFRDANYLRARVVKNRDALGIPKRGDEIFLKDALGAIRILETLAGFLAIGAKARSGVYKVHMEAMMERFGTEEAQRIVEGLVRIATRHADWDMQRVDQVLGFFEDAKKHFLLC